MRHSIQRGALAASLAGALALAAATPTWAAPMGAAGGLKAAAASSGMVTNVHWRGHGGGFAGFAAGAAIGALAAGAAAASSGYYYGGGYADPGYYAYEAPVVVAPAPVVVDPGYTYYGYGGYGCWPTRHRDPEFRNTPEC